MKKLTVRAHVSSFRGKLMTPAAPRSRIFKIQPRAAAETQRLVFLEKGDQRWFFINHIMAI
ncbi:MAG: hypothetical protein Q4E92_01100 [Jeotgalicoccus sp.]|nr:hypothetical protein [Jeotgalicoccus sp.]